MNKRTIFLLGTPEHGNLGDHAIAIAETKFIKEAKPNFNIIEITGAQFRHNNNCILEPVNKNDIIIITGGGFIGDLWIDEENMIRNIIQSYPKNKIIIFPQTIFFQDSNELNITRNIYQNHKHLFVCLRERISYNFCKDNLIGGKFKKYYLVPDMVMNLDICENTNKDGILLAFRKDKESILSQDDMDLIKKISHQKSQKVLYADTVVGKWLDINKREAAVNKLLNEFGGAKLVLTDRLHGMLFAVITGTACIAFNNLSKKVEATYKTWLSDYEYIKYVDNPNEIYRYINKFMMAETYNFNNAFLIKQYNILRKII